MISKPQSKLGTFTGVFMPTFLSIMGIIFFLRLGFIVGSGGLLTTIFIILLSVSVTLATGLSLSALTTTMRIGDGGTYSIVSKTLGLEVGGSVGIPLYLAQVFSVAFYIFGFGEVWRYMFPEHNPLVISLVLFGVLFLLLSIRLKFALRTQVLVFTILMITLGVVFLGNGDWWNLQRLVPLYDDQLSLSSFWVLFALFFPAVTGVTAGIGLSGELSDPKKQIPRGVISAIVLTTLLYIGLAIWFSYNASTYELVSEKLIIVSLSRYSWVVLIGILAASFTSASTRFLAAPRLMWAMAQHGIFPFSKFIEKKTDSGEPRRAVMISALFVFVILFINGLDAIAPVLTVFSLITYTVVNLAVYIELSLGLVSFRPTISIHRYIPLYGALSSITIIFVLNLFVGVFAMVFLISVYMWLMQRNLVQREGDIRSGLFMSISEWAAKRVSSLPGINLHTWKPNIFLPVLVSGAVLKNFPLIKAIVYPNGTMTVLGVRVKRKSTEPVKDQAMKCKESRRKIDPVEDDDFTDLPEIVRKFGEEGIFTFSSIVDVEDYSKGICISLEAIQSQVFHPNILFLPYTPQDFSKSALKRIFATAEEQKVSVMLFSNDDEMGLGSQRDINVWIHPGVLREEFYKDRDFDLSLLIAYKLQQNWNGIIKIWMCVGLDHKSVAESYLKKLKYEARLPENTETNVIVGRFRKSIIEAPSGDLHIIAACEDNLADIGWIARVKGKSFMFISDSSNEDILA